MVKATFTPRGGWRWPRRVAETYAGNPNVAALAVAGLGRRWPGRPVFRPGVRPLLARPPTDADRTRTRSGAVGGSLLDLWEFDEDDEEWSEDYRVGQLDVTVSNFLGASHRPVPGRRGRCGQSTEPVRHMRLAAIQRSRPLIGADLMASWRARAAPSPTSWFLPWWSRPSPRRHSRGWAAREALVSRSDDLAVTRPAGQGGGHGSQSRPRAQPRLPAAPPAQVAAPPDRGAFPGSGPARRAPRLAGHGPAWTALRTAETLLADTTALAEAHSGADLGAFREALSERRAARPARTSRLGRCRPGIARRSARAIIIDDHARLVLIKRTKPGRAPYWTTAGGGVEESDASVEAAMRREIFEELGAEAAGAVQVFMVSEQRRAAYRYSISCDPARPPRPVRRGPARSSSTSRGTYEVDYVDLRGSPG